MIAIIASSAIAEIANTFLTQTRDYRKHVYMNTQHLEPARSVVGKIGVGKAAEITGKHVSSVYRWMMPRDKGGTGGFVPTKHQQALLDYARANQIALTASDFFVA